MKLRLFCPTCGFTVPAHDLGLDGIRCKLCDTLLQDLPSQPIHASTNAPHSAVQSLCAALKSAVAKAPDGLKGHGLH